MKKKKLHKKLVKVIGIALLLFSNFLSSQELVDAENAKFQNFFFEALTQKAIENYDNAVGKLDQCNAIISKEKAVLFELSKNYYMLNKYAEAIEFGTQALEKDSNNIWILEHLVNVNVADRNFNKAIELQKKIITILPKKKGDLVFIHLRNRDWNSANKVLKELKEAKMLTPKLRRVEQKLLKRIAKQELVNKSAKIGNKERFIAHKNFENLKALLLELDKTNSGEFVKYSEEGVSLFPAQAFVYLMNGKALNKSKRYQEAVMSLETGLDFVIEDKQMEDAFYKQLVLSYRGLKDEENVKKYNLKLNR